MILIWDNWNKLKMLTSECVSYAQPIQSEQNWILSTWMKSESILVLQV